MHEIHGPLLWATLAGATLAANANAADAPKVVVTIGPVHSLVAGIMDGVAMPTLLLPGGGSPHAYSLKPSHARALQEAHIVIRVSENLETFLRRPIDNLSERALVLDLDKTEGLALYPAREGGIWESHEDGAERHGAHEKHDHDRDAARKDDHGHDDHARGAQDPHLWLDPTNAQKLATRITAELSRAYPTHTEAFKVNATRLNTRLKKLDNELKAATASFRGKPYIVLHDAYRYFEERYSLRPAGAITVSPERLPGARRLSAIRERINNTQAICVFAEPQFEPKLVLTLTEGTNARRGVLDPLGAELMPGADLYFALMRNLATGLSDCLAPRTQN